MNDPTQTDFDSIFADEIAPRLDVLEQARRHELPRLRRRAAAFAALSLAWLAALIMIGIPLLWLTVLPLAAIGLFIARQLRAAPGRDYAQALRAIVLPPLCAFAGGWRHERLDNRDIFRKGDALIEPDWPLFSLPDWRTPIPPIVRTDTARLLALLATAQPPAYPVPPRDQHKEPQVTPVTTESTCGEAAIRLLEAYGIDTVFGIPGVHTLELYRGLPNSRIRHITPRHEQGAAFMADGYARVTGRPAACLLTTGPGLTNAATGIAQAYSDSSPMLVLSSVNDRRDLGMGRGRLHELQSQRSAIAPLCAFSHTVLDPAELPEVMARAFGVFQSARPRPVHIEIPLDVLAAPASFATKARPTIGRPSACDAALVQAADLIAVAERPVLIIGGGARDCPAAVRQLAEGLGAAVLTTGAAKGVLPHDHPLSLGSSTDQPAMMEFVSRADAVIVAGCELAETDFWSGLPSFGGSLVRIDIDPIALTRDVVPDVALLGDAEAILCDLADRLATPNPARQQREIAAAREAARSTLPPLRRLHAEVLAAIRAALPPEGIVMSDMTQIAYAGNALWRTDHPRTWHHPHGYGTLGFALPAAIGAKLAKPDHDVVCLIGDGGLMFTVQDLMTSAELAMPLAIVMWNNDGYGQIRDEMIQRGIPEIGVTLKNPDHHMLAKAMGCLSLRADTPAALTEALRQAFKAPCPTLIEVRQDSFKP